MRRTCTIFLLISVMFFQISCTGINKNLRDVEPLSDFEASEASVQDMIHDISNRNNTLNTFKGLAKLTIKNKGKSHIFKAGLAGSLPDKIRIDAISISGEPFFSISNNGDNFYFYSHSEKRFDIKDSKKINLKNIIGIPIEPADIITLLFGRIPVTEYEEAMIGREINSEGYVLVLKRSISGVSEKIYLNFELNTGKAIVKRIDLFDISDSLIYSAVFIKTQKIGNYEVPLKMMITNGRNIEFKIDIYKGKYWPNVNIDDNVFVLSKPE